MTAVDEFYVEKDQCGRVLRQIARVRIFLLAFLSGMPDVELGVNDLPRQGLEVLSLPLCDLDEELGRILTASCCLFCDRQVVGRHDIIPVVTEEWIRLEDVEFHSCVDKAEFEKSRMVKSVPFSS